MVIFALLVGAATSRSEKSEKFLVPMLISIWVMGLMVVGFVFLSGVGLGELSASESREFLSPLGLHANDLGRLYAIAYALMLFACAESKQASLRVALVASMGMVVLALMFTFSRGAFLVSSVNVLFLLWRRNPRTLILLALLTVLAVLLLPGAVYDRITTGLEADSTRSAPGVSTRSGYRCYPRSCAVRFTAMASPPCLVRAHAPKVAGSRFMRQHISQCVPGGPPRHGNCRPGSALYLFCARLEGLRALSVDPALSPTLRGSTRAQPPDWRAF